MKMLTPLKKILLVCLCLCMMLPLTACGETKMSQRQVFAMDTIMTLTAYGKNADRGLTAAQGVIQSMNDMLDPDIETSTTYAINHANGGNTSISGQVANMLSTAQTIYKQSGGALDLTIYPVIQRWGFDSGRYYVPMVDIFLTACNEDLNAYINSRDNTYSSGGQEYRAYSNVEGGVGVFGARRAHIRVNVPCDSTGKEGYIPDQLRKLGVGFYGQFQP